MTTNARTSRRGAALLLTMIFAFMLTGVVVYLHTNSMNAAQVAVSRDNADLALGTAEFASELAVANLSNLELQPKDPSAPAGSANEYIVVNDWVSSAPFFFSGTDQRRISGIVNNSDENMEYRVLVRSLREAKTLTASSGREMPESWLNGINISEFKYNDPDYTLRKFSDTYEVTASARNANRGNARLASSSTLRTLVTLQYAHPLNDQENMAVFNIDDLAKLTPTQDLKVSGEDHYGIKTILQNVSTTIEVEEIDTMKGTDSMLFSVINHSWNTAEQTLQYKRDDDLYNPWIPRTVNYSTNALDRSMLALDDSNAVKDKYVFGGKRDTSRYYAEPTGNGTNITYGYGRSVNFAESDPSQATILETNKSQAITSLYSETAFVIGKFENFQKLYLNYTENPATKTSSTKSYVYSTTHPADTANASAIATWKNKWMQLPLTYWTANRVRTGQTNVQIPLDNKSSAQKRHMTTKFWIKNKQGMFLARDYKYTSAATPPDDWDGYYTWMYYYGYTDSEVSGSGRYHMTKTNYTGSSNKTLHTRFLTLEELLGYQVTKGSDGLPARLHPVTGAVISGSPDFLLDGNDDKIPYRLTVNGYQTQFDEAAQRANSSDNYGIKTSDIDNSRYPPRDGIYVVERDSAGNRVKNADGSLKVTVYRTMDDFAYEVDISEASEPEDLRTMVTIQMVVEQTPETYTSTASSPPNMYWDMGLCLSVVYPKYINEESAVSLLDGADKQWWEGLQEETMTTNTSHYALTARPYDEMKKEETAEDKLALFYQMGGLDSYAGGELDNIYTLGDENGENTTFKKAIFDTGEHSVNLGHLTNGTEPGTYYVGRDDLALILAALTSASSTYADLAQDYKDNGRDPLDIALNYIRGLSVNSTYTFKVINDRYNASSEYTKVQVSATTPSTLKVTDKYVASRNMAGEFFGLQPQNLTGKYMLRKDGGSLTTAKNQDIGGSGAPTDTPPTFIERLSFLPSEREVQPTDVTYSGESSSYLPITNTDHNTVQPNGHPLAPRIMFQSDYKTEMRRTPTWVNVAELRAAYGQRESESRSGLGWHRNGPRSTDDLMRDHYEYIIMGKQGFVPFALAPTGEIAFVRDYTSTMTAAEVANIEFTPVLKDPADMPTFVFEGAPLDGAGVLVVNGNLQISTEFAYHGTLIVLGDLRMAPKLTSVPKRNDEGLIVNAAGQVLLNDSSGYYFMEGTVRVPSTPHMTTEYTSKLVVQGQVFVGGSVRNNDFGSPRAPVNGIIDIRGSSGALQDTTGSMFDGKEKKQMYRLYLNDGDDDGGLWSDS